MQIERRTLLASARRTSSAMMQGCVNLREKPTVNEVGQNVARSYQWHRRTRGALDPADSSCKKGDGQRQRSEPASAGTRSGTSKPTKEHSFGKDNVILFKFGPARRPTLRDDCADIACVHVTVRATNNITRLKKNIRFWTAWMSPPSHKLGVILLNPM